MSLMPPLVTHSLHGGESVVTLHLAIFAIAIGVGSGLAAFLLTGRIVLLPAAIGALLVAASSIDLGLAELWRPAVEGVANLDIADYFQQPGALRASVDLAVLALAGGLMIVPSFAAIQAQSPADQRARTVAAVNVHNAAFMALGGAGVAFLQSKGSRSPRSSSAWARSPFFPPSGYARGSSRTRCSICCRSTFAPSTGSR